MANRRRKLTQEKADAINRRRDMLEDPERDWEDPPPVRLSLDESGRGFLVDDVPRDWARVAMKDPPLR